MKRFFINICSILVICLLSYTGLWYFQSKNMESFTHEAILSITKKLGGSKSDFVYESAKISGFPLGYKVQINKPRFILNDENISMKFSSNESLIIESDILGTKYLAKLPQNIDVKNIDVKTGEALENSFIIKYTEPATINLKASSGNFYANIFGQEKTSDSANKLNLSDFSYKDTGYKYINASTQDVIYSADESVFTFALLEDDSYNFTANVKNQFLKALDKKLYKEKNIGKLNLEADIIYNETSGDKLAFNKFILTSDIFSLDLQGNAVNSNIEAFPYGDLKIKIGNYEDFVEFQAMLINQVAEKSPFPFLKIKQEQIKSFKDFLKKVATEKSNNDKDIVITLKREEGQSVNIGKFSFIEAVHLYKGDSADMVKSEAADNFTSEIQ